MAQRARVSPSTVSNFVNGKFDAMGEKTRARVAKAIEALDYRPDSAARGLRTARQRAVGLLIVDESPRYLSDGSTTEVVAGLSHSLNSGGYTLQLEGLPASQVARSVLLNSLRSDGLCVLLSGTAAKRRRMLAQIRGRGQPIVLLHEKAPRGAEDICSLRQDDRRGGRLLAEHLLARGARHFMVVKASGNQWQAVSERERGIEEALKACSGETQLSEVGCGLGAFPEALRAIAAAFDREGLPDVVMGMNDQFAIAALKELRAGGIAVPGQVMVTGFNAFELWNYADVALTSVRSPGYELGQRAGEAMIARLTEGAFPTEQVILPVELILGETTR